MEKTIKKAKDAIKIAKCKCAYDFQDALYGKGMRVMNSASAKGAKPDRYRCTVCGTEHNL